MSKKSAKPSIADLIAATPGAQTREEALASIKARRARMLASPDAAQPADFSVPEPMPILGDPEAFARAFFQRKMQEAAPPPRGVKPRIVVRNDDDDPEPPKAA